MATGNDIEVIGASENNLKNVSVTVPKGRLVVFCGVSGSGKSSLAFDTIARESQRAWQESYPLFLRNKMPHYERPEAEELRNLTPAVVVDQKPLGASARSTVGTATDVAPLVRLLFSRVGEPSAGGSMAYSPNHPAGTCPVCSGLGEELVLDEDSLFDPERSLAEGAILFSQFSSGWQTYLYQANSVLDPYKRLADYTPEEWAFLREGPSGTPPKVEIRSNNTGRVDTVDYEGVVPRFRRLYMSRDISKLRKGLQEEILSHVGHGPCHACGGSGLNPKTLASKREHALGRGGPAREAGERARQDRRRLRARRAQHGPARTRRGGAANAASAHGRGRQQRDYGGSPHGARCPGRLGHRPGTRGRDWRRPGGLRGHARTAGGMQDVQDRRLAEEAHGLAPAAACRRTLRPEMAPIQAQSGLRV